MPTRQAGGFTSPDRGHANVSSGSRTYGMVDDQGAGSFTVHPGPRRPDSASGGTGVGAGPVSRRCCGPSGVAESLLGICSSWDPAATARPPCSPGRGRSSTHGPANEWTLTEEIMRTGSADGEFEATARLRQLRNPGHGWCPPQTRRGECQPGIPSLMTTLPERSGSVISSRAEHRGWREPDLCR